MTRCKVPYCRNEATERWLGHDLCRADATMAIAGADIYIVVLTLTRPETGGHTIRGDEAEQVLPTSGAPAIGAIE